VALPISISSYFATTTCLILLLPLAKRIGLMDVPGGRKTHTNTTPLIGGLGIYLGLLAVCIVSPILQTNYQALLLLSGSILIIGLVDDLLEMPAASRFLSHGCVALAMAWTAGVQLESFGDILATGPIQLGILSIPVTIFATIGVINAVNMSDGVDGLSSGMVSIALVFLALAAMLADASTTLNFTLLLLMALVAFLSFNFRLIWGRAALMFLGDAGSTMLGFMLAWLLIDSTQGDKAFLQPVYALWLFAVPLMDTVRLLIKRPLQGKSPFTPGRDHLHHLLLAAGYSQTETVLMIYALATLLAMIGIGAHLLAAPESFMFLLFLSLFAIYLLATSEKLSSSENASIEQH